MANHFSALKRARQTERRTARNRANTSRLRGALRELRETIANTQQVAASVAAGSMELRGAARQISEGASNQASSVEQTSSALLTSKRRSVWRYSSLRPRSWNAPLRYRSWLIFGPHGVAHVAR